MATIKPFRGIRPPQELVEEIECRPYDVLDSEEARAEAGDNEKSLYHITKPEIDFEPGTSEYEQKVYEQAQPTLSCSKSVDGSSKTRRTTTTSTRRP